MLEFFKADTFPPIFLLFTFQHFLQCFSFCFDRHGTRHECGVEFIQLRVRFVMSNRNILILRYKKET